MKYNLKNLIVRSLIHGFFKHAVEDKADTLTIHMSEAKTLVDWFEGFEKELHKILGRTGENRVSPMVRELIKEILGEEAK